jgi:hypothetical protein
LKFFHTISWLPVFLNEHFLERLVIIFKFGPVVAFRKYNTDCIYYIGRFKCRYADYAPFKSGKISLKDGGSVFYSQIGKTGSLHFAYAASVPSMGTPLNFKCCASVWANDDSEMHSEINIKQMFFM